MLDFDYCFEYSLKQEEKKITHIKATASGVFIFEWEKVLIYPSTLRFSFDISPV